MYYFSHLHMATLSFVIGMVIITAITIITVYISLFCILFFLVTRAHFVIGLWAIKFARK
jgi:hypothetical protein